MNSKFQYIEKQMTKHRGFSLAEAMMAVVVMAIVSAGALLPLTSGQTIRAEGQRKTLAAKLACDMMEELIETPFDDLVNNYDGFTEDQGGVTDCTGGIFSDPMYAKFSITVQIEYPASGSDMLLMATVRVYYDGKEMANLKRLIGQR